MFTILLGLFVTFLIIYWYLIKHKNLPPGPTGIPLLGYIPWLIYYSKNPLILIESLKKYGNIVCIRIGFSYMIILYDMDTIKQAFSTQGNHFSGRGLKLIQKEVTNSKGIVSSEGEYQKENRRFMLRSLRNLGFGKISFEEPIMESIQKMCDLIDEHIHHHPEESFDFRQCLTEAVAENIAGIILGTKFNKQQLTFIIETLEKFQNIPQIFFLAGSFPFTLNLVKFKFFKKFIGLDSFIKFRIPFQNMIIKYVRDHKATFNRNNISDFLYSYIEEQSFHKDTKDSFWWDDDQIMHACTELIGAGVGTTESTITTFLYLMANNQTLLQNVTEEIDRVIGQERKPSSRDLSSLPLCEASILETLRWSSLASIGIPHATTESTNLLGYSIPKDSTVVANLYNVAKDAKVWPDPENFNPTSNFLKENGKEIINREKFIPFSIGRRSCIGESLAKMEITLFCVTLLQKYSVSLDHKLGMTPLTDGIFRNPIHRRLIFRSRK